MPIKTNIQTTNIDNTQTIEDYALKQFGKLDKIINDDDSAIADIELAKTIGGQHSGEIYKAEINLHIKGAQLYAQATEADLYAAIDRCSDEILNEVKKTKSKRATLARRGARRIKQMLRRL